MTKDPQTIEKLGWNNVQLEYMPSLSEQEFLETVENLKKQYILKEMVH